MIRTLTVLFIGADNDSDGHYVIDGAAYDSANMKPLERFHFRALTPSGTYTEAYKINEKWSLTGMVIPYLQRGTEAAILKEKAATTANSNRPAGKTSHPKKSPKV